MDLLNDYINKTFNTDKEHEINEAKLIAEEMDFLEPFVQQFADLTSELRRLTVQIQEIERYKARMKKYEWIENLLQSATQFFRYLLPKKFR